MRLFKRRSPDPDPQTEQDPEAAPTPQSEPPPATPPTAEELVVATVERLKRERLAAAGRATTKPATKEESSGGLDWEYMKELRDSGELEWANELSKRRHAASPAVRQPILRSPDQPITFDRPYNRDPDPEFIRCPFCDEEIRFQAKKCKHCGEWLFKPKKATD